MAIDKNIWEYEKNHLQKVINEIKIQLAHGNNAVSNYKKEAIELQKKMREDVKCAPSDLFDLENVTEMWQYQTALSNQARKYKFSYDMVSHLERMIKSPYFGRIDFVEDGEEKAEQIYIGIHNLSIKNTMEILVYDWRAPISSMFYDFETGFCSYECAAGSTSGQMLLKRQYKIENSNILYMFDSSLSINDEMLREILGKSTDDRMKTIVTSIQREQNAVIRNSESKILIVEGPAGSGKTSIALHRAAYLLYKYRDKIKSDNILVFSPNHVFEDYISNVLPELGEENVQRSTFADFFISILGTKYRIETMNQQMEYILSDFADKTRVGCIKFKASTEFINILNKYVDNLQNGINLKFKDIFYNGELLITGDDTLRLFKDDYSHFTYAKRLEKLRQRLFYLLEQSEEKRVRESAENGITDEEKRLADEKAKAELDGIKNDIAQRTTFDIFQLYSKLLRNINLFSQPADIEEREDFHSFGLYTVQQLEQGLINYEDVAPIIFLNVVLDTVGNTKAIKHVIIDEAQDYTAIHYEILKNAFENCNMTILGDVNQSVNGYMNIGSFDKISAVFNMKDTRSISLTKSYRSSKEIADFCKQILMSQNNPEQLDRHGSKPKITKLDKSSLCRKLADDIISLKSQGHKLIAVICKTASQCEGLYKSLSSYVDISLVSNQNEVYQGGTVIIPSYLAKGLEFDAVLVDSIEASEYSREEDRRLLYTVCTRALHELYLYYFDNMTTLLKNMGEDFYTSDIFVG